MTQRQWMVVLAAGYPIVLIAAAWWAGGTEPRERSVRDAIMTHSIHREGTWQSMTQQGTAPGAAIGHDAAVPPVSATEDEPENEPAMAWFPDSIVDSDVAIAPASGVGSVDLPSPGSAMVARQQAAGESFDPEHIGGSVDTGRPGTTRSRTRLSESERHLWEQQLADLGEDATDEILALRQSLGSVATETLGILNAAGPHTSPSTSSTVTESAASERVPTAALPRRFVAPPEFAMHPAAPRVADHPAPGGILQTNGTAAGSIASQLIRELNEVYIANSINAATIGYRRQEVLLLSAPLPLLTDRGLDTAPSSTAGVAAGTVSAASRPAESIRWLRRTSATAGRPIETGNPMDLMIEGDGWFCVEHGARRCYSRAGLLAITSDRRLGLKTSLGVLPLFPPVPVPEMTIGGLMVAPDGRCVVLSPSAASVNVSAADGGVPKVIAADVNVDAAGLSASESAPAADARRVECGQIVLFRLLDPSALRLTPDGLYEPAPSIEFARATAVTPDIAVTRTGPTTQNAATKSAETSTRSDEGIPATDAASPASGSDAADVERVPAAARVPAVARRPDVVRSPDVARATEARLHQYRLESSNVDLDAEQAQWQSLNPLLEHLRQSAAR